MTGEPMSLQCRAAVTVAALTAAGKHEDLRVAAEMLVEAGARPADLREAAYLTSLYCGFPRGVAALVALAELPGEQEEWEVHRSGAAADRATLAKLGLRLFRRIHQSKADRQLEMLERIHPDFADTVLSEAYGRVLAREFLPLPTRELIAVTALTVAGLLPQLRAHLLGAHNTGAPWSHISECVRIAADLGSVDAEEALQLLDEVSRPS